MITICGGHLHFQKKIQNKKLVNQKVWNQNNNLLFEYFLFMKFSLLNKEAYRKNRFSYHMHK